jgi:hypothetical protein
LNQQAFASISHALDTVTLCLAICLENGNLIQAIVVRSIVEVWSYQHFTRDPMRLNDASNRHQTAL